MTSAVGRGGDVERGGVDGDGGGGGVPHYSKMYFEQKATLRPI